MSNPFSYTQLRKKRLAKATRPFLARGILQKRCSKCLLAEFSCICHWKKSVTTDLDIILLMHTDEILKPTNTGRLISDVLPENCFAFEWSRTEPDSDLLKLLNDPKREIVIIYPTQENRTSCRYQPQIERDKKLTLLVLDGTWRQSKKIFNLSEWLQPFPTFELDVQTRATYGLRKAPHANQLSTAEATVIALAQANELAAAKVLDNYFSIFNHHYSASRSNKPPQLTQAHTELNNNSTMDNK